MSTDTVRLWDPVIRIGHWSLVAAFIGDYFLNEAGDGWHRWLGYYAVAVVLVRVAWGFVGPRSARWADFWPRPARLVTHAKALLSGGYLHHMGHSPLGGLVMILMLLLMVGLGVTGFLMEEVDYFWGEDLPRDIHVFLADSLFWLACLHVAAALVESVRMRENLPWSMVTGRRKVRTE
ncbi:cytochrome b/b6 domain-containing protein [Pseudomonas sp. TCU-HL1]|uniref:cytochrome b/b6 domain-containing protein n=1 Tax=Pseudomonas sp. TCU-HL1 TaxID=1856685 RepID=UPI00083D0C38|nr:cytochrome b/b6 domain-containing protein [Pseudomonas sp. TCU-HL1]AOE87598.1 cytochrome B561 [Pseudomonas sp. TCU-HL1]